MSQYDNTNRGVLFENENKRNDKSPDYSGTLNVDGVEFFLDAWEKTAQSGRSFMSVSVKLKTKQAPAQAPVAPRRAPPPAGYAGTRQQAQSSPPDDWDDIPL